MRQKNSVSATPRQRALDYLKANPDKQGLSVRELAELTGISKDAFQRAKKTLE